MINSMKLLITREIPQAGINLLKDYPQIELDYRKGPPLSPDKLGKAIADVDAIIPVIPDQISEGIIKSGKKLKIIDCHHLPGLSEAAIVCNKALRDKRKNKAMNIPKNIVTLKIEELLKLISALKLFK